MTSSIFPEFAGLQQIQKSASVINLTWNLRNGIRNIGNKTSKTIVNVAASPLMLLMLVISMYSVWKLGRVRPSSYTLNAGNYKGFWQHYESLKHICEALSPVQSINLSKATYWSGIYINQIIKVLKILSRNRDAMALKISEQDIPIGDLPEGWAVLKSDERWKNRPTPYEYLV